MSVDPHYDIEEHIGEFYACSEDTNLNRGSHWRWAVLSYLMLRADWHGRAFPGRDRVMRATSINQTGYAVTMKWLFERGAIYNVPPAERKGKEQLVPLGGSCWQLTGVIRLDGGWCRYGKMRDDDIEEAIAEWATMRDVAPPDLSLLTPSEEGFRAGTGGGSAPEPGGVPRRDVPRRNPNIFQ